MRTSTRRKRSLRSLRNENEHDLEHEFAPRSTRKRPRNGRRWLIIAGVLALLAWAAPMIVAYTPLRNMVLASVGSDLKGTVTAGSASLGWFSPVVLNDVEIRGSNGDVILQVSSVRGSSSLFSLITGGNNLGSFELQKPLLHVQFAANGSNLESLLDKYLDGPSREPTPRVSLRVIQGEVLVDDALTQSRWRVGELSSQLRIGSDDDAPLTLNAAGQLVQPDRVSQFDIKLETSLSPPIGEAAKGVVTLESGNFPLPALQPWLRRIRPGTQMAGWLNGSVTCTWGEDRGMNVASVTSDLSAEQFMLRDSALGNDILRLEKLHLPCQLSIRGGRLSVQELNVFSDAGDVQFGGRLEMPLNEGWQAAVEALRTHEYEVIARLNLARLANSLPQTLHIRPATRIESGNFQAHISHKGGPDGAAWRVLAETSNLAGFNAGQKVVWDRPIRLELTARETPQGPVIDVLHCESEFLKLDAEGTTKSFSISAEHNLDRLAAELGRFVDLGSVRLGGTGWSYLSWDRNPNGQFEGQYECQIRDFEFTLPGRPAWREPLVLALLKATGSTDGQFNLQSVRTASLQIESGSERAKATLLEAVPQVAENTAWPVRLDLEGALPQLIARAEPLLGRQPNWDVRGQLRMSSHGTVSQDYVAVRQCQAVVTNLVARGGNWNIQDQQVQVGLEGSWRQSARRGEIQRFTLAGNSFTADSQRAILDLPLQGAPQFSGNVNFTGDLAKLQAWHPKFAALELAGNVNGSARLAQTGMQSDWELQTQWKNASLVSPNWRWSEPSMSIAMLAKYDELRDSVQIDRVTVDSRSLRLAGQGVVDNLKNRPSLEMAGTLDYDYQNLLPLLKSYVGDGVKVSLNRRSRPFQVAGPLTAPQAVAPSVPAASPGKEWLSEWTVATPLDWTAVEAYGFRVGAGEIQAYLNQGTAGVRPFDLAINNGRFTAAPQLVLVGEKPEFQLQPGLLLEKVEVTEEMCSRGLKYVAPLLANATRPEGRFSLDTTGCRIPLGNVEKADMAGRLMVHDITVTPGPLLHLIASSINAVRLASGKTSGFTRTEVARLKRESVISYRLVDGRVYHQNLELDFDDVTVSTRGSVGLDQSLAIVAHVTAPKLFAQVPGLSGLQTQGLDIPIHGTLSEPKLDRGQLQSQAITGILSDDNLRKVGGDAVQKLLNKGLNNGSQELKGDKLFQNLDQGLKGLFGPR